MLDIADHRGLVCGYRVDPGGHMAEVVWDGIDEAIAAEDTLVWLHFDQTDARARAWIEACTIIPPQARALLLGTSGHMRIEAVGPGLAGVVGDLHHELTQKGDRLGVLRLYLDRRLLISTRREPLSAVDKLRRALGEGLKAQRPITLIIEFLHHVTDTLGDLIVEQTEAVDRTEEVFLDGEDQEEAGDELSRVRRTMARLRRHMIPQQHALAGLLARLPPWIEPEEAGKLSVAIERLSALGHDLDLVQERARLLQEQAAARLMAATNRNLYVLSIVTTIFLPITLITGVFGMNLGGLPWQQDGMGFWYGLAIMAAIATLTLVVLRRRRMI